MCDHYNPPFVLAHSHSGWRDYIPEFPGEHCKWEWGWHIIPRSRGTCRTSPAQVYNYFLLWPSLFPLKKASALRWILWGPENTHTHTHTHSLSLYYNHCWVSQVNSVRARKHTHTHTHTHTIIITVEYLRWILWGPENTHTHTHYYNHCWVSQVVPYVIVENSLPL